MNKLSELNYYSTVPLSFTDDRIAQVLFDRQIPASAIINTGVNFPFVSPVGINITEIVKPEVMQVYFELDVSAVPGTTVTWDTIPTGMSVSNPSADVYRVFFIDTAENWDIVKSPTIEFPQNTDGEHTYYATIHYQPSKTKQWGVLVKVGVVSFINATVTLSALPSNFLVSSANLSSLAVFAGSVYKTVVAAATAASNASIETIYSRFRIQDASINLSTQLSIPGSARRGVNLVALSSADMLTSLHATYALNSFAEGLFEVEALGNATFENTIDTFDYFYQVNLAGFLLETDSAIEVSTDAYSLVGKLIDPLLTVSVDTTTSVQEEVLFNIINTDYPNYGGAIQVSKTGDILLVSDFTSSGTENIYSYTGENVNYSLLNELTFAPGKVLGSFDLTDDGNTLLVVEDNFRTQLPNIRHSIVLNPVTEDLVYLISSDPNQVSLDPRMIQYNLSDPGQFQSSLQSITVTDNYTGTRAFAFNADGTQYYILSFQAGPVITQWNAVSPYNVAGTIANPLVSSRSLFSLVGENQFTRMVFNPNGLTAYFINLSTQRFVSCALNTAWAIATLQGIGQSIQFSEFVIDSTTDFKFNSNGTKFFALDGNTLYSYNLSTAYNVATRTFVTSASIPVFSSLVQGFDINPSGTELYATHSTSTMSTAAILKYSMSTPFDITTLSLVRRTPVNTGAAIKTYERVNDQWTVKDVMYPFASQNAGQFSAISGNGSTIVVSGASGSSIFKNSTSEWSLTASSTYSGHVDINSDGSVAVIGPSIRRDAGNNATLVGNVSSINDAGTFVVKLTTASNATGPTLNIRTYNWVTDTWVLDLDETRQYTYGSLDHATVKVIDNKSFIVGSVDEVLYYAKDSTWESQVTTYESYGETLRVNYSNSNSTIFAGRPVEQRVYMSGGVELTQDVTLTADISGTFNHGVAITSEASTQSTVGHLRLNSASMLSTASFVGGFTEIQGIFNTTTFTQTGDSTFAKRIKISNTHLAISNGTYIDVYRKNSNESWSKIAFDFRGLAHSTLRIVSVIDFAFQPNGLAIELVGRGVNNDIRFGTYVFNAETETWEQSWYPNSFAQSVQAFEPQSLAFDNPLLLSGWPDYGSESGICFIDSVNPYTAPDAAPGNRFGQSVGLATVQTHPYSVTRLVISDNTHTYVYSTIHTFVGKILGNGCAISGNGRIITTSAGIYVQQNDTAVWALTQSGDFSNATLNNTGSLIVKNNIVYSNAGNSWVLNNTLAYNGLVGTNWSMSDDGKAVALSDYNPSNSTNTVWVFKYQ